MEHVGQLEQHVVFELKSVVAALVLTLGASSDEDLAVVGLYGSKPDGDVEVDVQDLPLLLEHISVVVVYGALIKLEEMDAVHLASIFKPTKSVLHLCRRPLVDHLILLAAEAELIHALSIEVRHTSCQLPIVLRVPSNLREIIPIVASVVVTKVVLPSTVD